MRNIQITDDIVITENAAKYDNACKVLLANKPILARIMKYCVAEYKDCDIRDIEEKYIEGTPEIGITAVMPNQTNSQSQKITGMPNEDTSVNEGTILYDIRFHALAPQGNELIKLILNVETQNQYSQTYPLIKRGIYYGSRMISAQYGVEFTHSHYEDIKKIYSIWICPKPPKEKRNTVEWYKTEKTNLIGTSYEDERNYQLLNVIMIHLGDETESRTGIIQMLDVLLSNKKSAEEKIQILENRYEIPMTDHLLGEVEYMCNLSTGVYLEGQKNGIEKGIEKGIKKGIEKGIGIGVERGRAEGKEDAILQNIRTLMKKSSMTFEQAAALLDVPDEECEKYKRLLWTK